LGFGRLVQAVFEFEVTGEKKPRKATIRPTNIAVYDRDGDSVLIEQWLRLRGFVIERANLDAEAPTVLVNPRNAS
jgi:hypothetical protein